MSWRDIVRKEEKPDFLDLDGDGNKTEPMKEAAKNKKHDDTEKKAKMKCPKCKGKGCAHCNETGYHEVKSKNPFTRKD